MNVKLLCFFNDALNYLFEIVSLQKVGHAMYTCDKSNTFYFINICKTIGCSTDFQDKHIPIYQHTRFKMSVCIMFQNDTRHRF